MNQFTLISLKNIERLAMHLALFLILVLIGEQLEAEEPESPYFLVKGATDTVDMLPLKSVEAGIEIVGTIARVELIQTYANVGGEAIEAVYVFPGSTRAAVHGMEMRVGDRVVQAQIQKKSIARQTYEEAKSEGQTASLLEQQRANVFQMNLANILPGEVVEVVLRYSEWIVRDKDEYLFELPLVVGPRFAEIGSESLGESRALGLAADRIRYSIGARIRSAMAVESATCLSHSAEVVFPDSRSVDIRLEGDGASVGDRDFRIKYRLSGDAVKSGLWVSESNGEKYFMAALEPPVPGERKRMRREYFFVVDVSGSMGGFPLDTAKRMLESLVARLDEEDLFNLLLFAGDSQVFSQKSVPATLENLLAGVEFLYNARGGGGTRLLPALKNAYDMDRDPSCSRSIVVLTDGYISVEEAVFELIRGRLHEANVFACGIGRAPNRHLIEGMARVGRGEAFFVSDPSESEFVADRFSGYVCEPVLSQLKYGFSGVTGMEVEPPSLPDLLAERPVMLFGKFEGGGEGSLTLRGVGGEFEYVETLDFANSVDLGESPALEYIWARERVRRLSDYNRLWYKDSRVQEVTQLGLKHSLLTKYTSFVAVDKKVRRLGDEDPVLVKQAVPLPEGMKGQGEAGLSVPVTPEPEMWALMGLIAVAVSWILARRGF